MHSGALSAALITGVVVAFSGLIGFVAFMMTHLVRFAACAENTRVLPLSAIAGAILLVLADTIARIVLAPDDMPNGVVTGLAGGVFSLRLMDSKP
jgi:iron complex transport system permease protein